VLRALALQWCSLLLPIGSRCMNSHDYTLSQARGGAKSAGRFYLIGGLDWYTTLPFRIVITGRI